jgi:hypothetical protein
MWKILRRKETIHTFYVTGALVFFKCVTSVIQKYTRRGLLDKSLEVSYVAYYNAAVLSCLLCRRLRG